MKKILTLIIALAMLLTMSLSAFAAVPSNLTGFITDPAGLNWTAPVIRNLDVPVDMKVDLGMTGNYIDGPVSETISAYQDYANYKATIYMADVKTLFNTLYDGGALLFADPESAHLKTRLENCLVTGQFTIKITYPENAVIPAAVLTGTSLAGFDASAATTFEETVPRAVANGAAGYKELTITLDVKPGITASAMNASLDTYLPDITFTATGITIPTGINKVTGTITGQTNIYDVNADPTPDDLICTINYTGKQGTDAGVTGTEISETVIISYGSGITVTPSGPSGPSGPVPGKTEDSTVTVVVGGNNDNMEVTADNGKINADEITQQVADTREGFVVKGVYDSETGGNKLTGDVEIDKDTTVYVQWINTTVPSELESDTHIKYIEGYPDETVKPENNISREEVATIFYRLLKDEKRNELLSAENSFSDVEEDRWSNEAVSTMANGGYITGYTDGTFRPEGYITRAELATIAARFLTEPVSGNKNFKDIDGHWAEEYILSIANNEWIFGDGDGSFRPDDYITRAEAITIINRILVRYVNDEGLTGNEIDWIDNDENAWYYHAIIESSNEHDHTRAEDNYTEIWNTVE